MMRKLFALAAFSLVLGGCSLVEGVTDPIADVITGSDDETARDEVINDENLSVAGSGGMVLGEDSVTQYTTGSSASYGHPHVSYDGRWLAYSSDKTGMNRHVFVQPKESPSARQITHGSSNNVHPQISMDSRQVAFASNRDGMYRIYAKSIQGGGPVEEISNPSYESLAPTWSPDGRKVAYMTRRSSSSVWMIAIKDRSNGRTTYLTTGGYPDWSPDGARIVFQRASNRDPGYTALYTIEPDGTRETQVYSSDSHGAITPAWAGPNKILFATVNKSKASNMRRNDEYFNADDIWMVDREGTMPRRLSAHRMADWDPCFDHEASEIIYISNRDKVQNIFGIRVNLYPSWKNRKFTNHINGNMGR